MIGILRRLNLLPWLSLRIAHRIAGHRKKFYRLVRYSQIINVLASLFLHAMFLTALWPVSGTFAASPWVAGTV